MSRLGSIFSSAFVAEKFDSDTSNKSISGTHQPGFFEDSIRVLRFSVQRINIGFTILHGKWEEYILDNGGLLTYYYSGIIFLDSGGQRVWMRPHRLPDVETWKFLNNF